MPAKSWPSGAMTTTTSGRIPRSGTKPRSKRAGRLSYLTAPRPARLPSPKLTIIKKPDSGYERGTTRGAGQPVSASWVKSDLTSYSFPSSSSLLRLMVSGKLHEIQQSRILRCNAGCTFLTQVLFHRFSHARIENRPVSGSRSIRTSPT